MVRKKSSASKIKTRKVAYRRKQDARLYASRSWRILLLTVRAVQKFSNFKRKKRVASYVSERLNSVQSDSIYSDCHKYVGSTETHDKSMNPCRKKEQCDNLIIIKSTIKKIVSKVCRLEYERNRQTKNRKRKLTLKSSMNNELLIMKQKRQKIWSNNKYSQNSQFREEKKQHVIDYFRDKYKNNKDFRIREKKRIKTQILLKYHNNTRFRVENNSHASRRILNKYHNNLTFRNKIKTRSKIYILNKYHNNGEFRNQYKARAKTEVLKKYYTDNSIRWKMIERALHSYRSDSTLMKRNSRQLYNQRRRILKKYVTFQSYKCSSKHKILYINSLKEFRRIILEGPDFVCLSCRLTFFRYQVIPFIKEKYIKQTMSFEIKTKIQSYFNHIWSREQKWICKLCSDKIKKQQMPSRSLLNRLEVCEIPSELKKLNNLEKHLIALRLPFMKIVNLISGKLSSRLAQKGTKGPLHCVPSDVEDTVTALPRPVDKSMMVRLQLKRRLQYKAVWEEQLINPNDVRDALFTLTKMHPGYKNIKINTIHENYLTSDQEKNYDSNIELVVEPMDVDTILEETVIEKTQVSNENYLKRLALGDIDDTFDSDEEIDEDDKDIRTKYNIGTDSCTQPCDFNDFLVFDKEPCIVAPAEKNKLSSLLIDKTIEALAFPHLFPNGQGSYDEERETNLTWKEYCKARLFSSDSRFAADSSYIFYLQYLVDLKQVYSGINIAFRKKLPMNTKQSLDEMQMKFLMNKDMIYRHLQCVRGSPQYWRQRLKDLFGIFFFPTRRTHLFHHFVTR